MAARRYIDDLMRDPLLRRGWQHDDRQPTNPAKPGVRPQKVPLN